MGEAVWIVRTGAKQILNYKSMYNRCSLPRIVAKEAVDETTLGDMTDEVVAILRKDKEPEMVVMTRRMQRIESLKDKKNWGWNVIDVEEDGIVDLSILNANDEELIKCLIDILEEDDIIADNTTTNLEIELIVGNEATDLTDVDEKVDLEGTSQVPKVRSDNVSQPGNEVVKGSWVPKVEKVKVKFQKKEEEESVGV